MTQSALSDPKIVISPAASIEPLPIAAPLESSHPQRLQWWLVAVVVIVALATRIDNILFGLLNSDEPQHMHVLWAMSHVGVQYRDFWDNHAPLFYILWRPILALVPQNANALLWMRLTSLPVNLLTIFGTYAIGRSLFDRRVGLWAGLVLLSWPTSQRLSIEIRPDHLWALFWVGALIVLAAGIRGAQRSAIFGLLLGATISVSLKSSVLIACLVGAAIMTRTLAGPNQPLPWRERLLRAIGFLAGFVAVPLAIIVWFWRLGALHDLYSGTLGVNFSGQTTLPHKSHIGIVLFFVFLVITWFALRKWIAGATLRDAARRQVFFICASVLCIASFKCLWPIFERQDWLPLAPMMVVSISGIVIGASKWVLDRRTASPRLGRVAGPILLIVLSVVAIGLAPYRQYNAKYYSAVNAANILAGPNEPVIDQKGELIFHPRAVWFVCETLTRMRLKHDPQADHGPESIVQANAMLTVSTEHRFPARTRLFLKDNFLPIGSNLCVAGKIVQPKGTASAEARFNLELPGEYDIRAAAGAAPAGTIDGQPITGPVTLAAGQHVIQWAQPVDDQIAIVWHRAIARGYSVVWSTGPK